MSIESLQLLARVTRAVAGRGQLEGSRAGLASPVALARRVHFERIVEPAPGLPLIQSLRMDMSIFKDFFVISGWFLMDIKNSAVGMGRC
jgi:hypothetical protein